MLPPVVRNKNFLRLWLAQLLSQIALNALIFVLTIKIYQLTSSNISVSLLILAFGLPAVLFGYLAGVYVDKLGLKRVLVGTNLIRTLLIITLFWLLKVPVFIYPIAFLISLATQFFIPAEGSAIPALVKKEDLISANSLFSLTLNSAMILGFVGAGPFLRIFTLNGTLIILTGLFAAALILVFSLPKSLSNLEVEKRSLFSVFFEGLVFIWRQRAVRNALFFLTITQSLVMVLATVAPGYVNKELGLDVEEISTTLMAPAALGMIFGSIFLSKWENKLKERTVVNGGLIGVGVGLFLLSVVVKQSFGHFAQLFTIIILFGLGFGNALITIHSTTAMQSQTPEELRGRVYGVLATLVSGAAMFPVIVAGGVADIFGVTKVVLFSGIILFLLGLYRVRGYLTYKVRSLIPGF